uniref:Uncharacterized protein n=1 Tax=Anguilla anguilla TaxID=7936 RepID=A0A0E9VFD8_ANGAN
METSTVHHISKFATLNTRDYYEPFALLRHSS